MTIPHNELLNVPLQNWSLQQLQEHLEYLRKIASLDAKHSMKLIDDCLKLEAYIEYKNKAWEADKLRKENER